MEILKISKQMSWQPYFNLAVMVEIKRNYLQIDVTNPNLLHFDYFVSTKTDGKMHWLNMLYELEINKLVNEFI